MIRLAILSAALLFALPATAQILPDPGPTNPRLQTVTWQNGQPGPATPGIAVVLKARFENSALADFSMGLREEDDGG